MALVIPAWQEKWIEVVHPKSGDVMLVKARYDPDSDGIIFVFDDEPRNFEIERLARKRWRLAEAERARGMTDGQAEVHHKAPT